MRRRVLTAVTVIGIAGTAWAAAQTNSVTVTCGRASHQYRLDEAAEFDVTSAVTGLPVRVSFLRGYLPIKSFDTTTPVRVSHRLGEPGFIVCKAQALDSKGPFGPDARAGAGFEPSRIRTALPPPKDYDAFWESAFAEQAVIEPDFTVRQLSNDVQLVSCQTVQGMRMYGFLYIPKGRGPFPLQVNVGGGDSVRCVEDEVGKARDGRFANRAFLDIHLPPWEPSAWSRKEASEAHGRWKAENNTTSLYRWNGEKPPRERWYYRCILGSCRLVEYAAQRPGVDPARVYYTGASTGGGYGVFLAAFSPYIRAAICEVPNYGNAGGPSVGRPSGEDDRGEHWQTSLYYDSAYCAPRITCPVFMSCGYLDDYCTPETVYCIYNELKCRKVMYDKVENGHGDRPRGYDAVRDAWLEDTLGLLAIEGAWPGFSRGMGDREGRGELKYMTFNLWGAYFGNPVCERDLKEAAYVLRNAPDVIGMQEAMPDFWNSRLFAKLECEYGIVRDPTNAVRSYNPLLYRKRRLELVEGGTHVFAAKDNPGGSKGFAWAVLRDKATGKSFISYSAHLWWKSRPLEKRAEFDRMRVNNGRELLATVEALKKKYGKLPVIGGGDLNTTENVRLSGRETPLNDWMAAGYCDAQYVVKGASPWSSNHGDPVRNEQGTLCGVVRPGAEDPKNSLDHVHYAKDSVEPLSLLVDRAQDALECSDHSPVVFTFRLK